MEGKKTAYIVISCRNEDEYLGGIMVVDRRGLPLEFHYTEKVNPTKLQKILYGDVLDKFIKENVLSENLFKAIKAKPDLLIIGERNLDIEQGNFKLPIVYLERTTAEPLKEVGDCKKLNEGSVLLQAQGHGYPLMVRFLNVKPEEQESVLEKLRKISETMDLLEPIVRIETALKEVEDELLEAKEDRDD